MLTPKTSTCTVSAGQDGVDFLAVTLAGESGRSKFRFAQRARPVGTDSLRLQESAVLPEGADGTILVR